MNNSKRISQLFNTMRFRIIGLALLISIAGCSGDSVLTPIPASATILAFGDSLTAGNGAAAENSYPEQLSRLLNRPVVNAGISGEESGEGLARLASLLDQHRPALLILCHGGNDLLRKRPVSQLGSNLREMIAMAQGRGIQTLLLGVPAPGIFLSSEDVYEEVAQEMGVAFIPELVADILSKPSLKADTVHPNAEGYSEMATGIFLELQNLGAL